MKRILCKIFMLMWLVLVANTGWAQSLSSYRSHTTDSLQALLRQPQLPDSQRVLTLDALGQEYLGNDDASSLRVEQQALALARRTGFTRGELIVLGDLSRTSAALQELPQAERWAEQMQRRAWAVSPALRRFRVVALQTLAAVAVEQENNLRALRYLRQALALIPQVDPPGQFPLLPLFTYYGLSELYTNRVLDTLHPADSLRQLAYFYTVRFAAQARRKARPDMLAAAYLGLGRLSHLAGSDSASYYFKQTALLYHDIGYGSMESNAYQVWADLERRAGRYPAAIAHARYALRLAQAAHSLDNAANASNVLADALADAGQPAAAYRQGKQAWQLRDSIQQMRNHDQLQKLQVQFDTQRQTSQIRVLTQQQAMQQQRLLLAGTGLLVVAMGAALVSVLALRLRRSRVLLAAQNEELTHTRAAQDQLYALVAHDLRSPMVAFSGLADLLHRYIQRQDTERLANLSGHIRQSAQKLTELLDNLLNWALSQRGELTPVPQPLCVQALLAEIATLYQHATQAANVSLIIDAPLELTVLADPNMTRTILRNLTGNALQATPQGGLITLSAWQQAGGIRLQVADTGTGLSPEALQELSTDSVRLRVAHQQRGAGLGLLLSRVFAQAQGGSLRLANAPAGPGVQALLTLPAAA